MPLYEYECLACRKTIESLESMDTEEIECEVCNAVCPKLVSATKGLVRNGTPCFHPNRKKDHL